MGNKLTLQKTSFLKLSNLNNKFYLLGSNLLKHFKQLLLIKNILLINENLNYINNKIFFKGSLFFKTVILKKYKKINKVNIKNKKDLQSEFITNHIFESIKTKFKLNSFIFSFSILNGLLYKKVTKVFFKKLKKFTFLLFDRRYNLFLDFIKIVSLYYINLVDTKTFLYIITEVFKYLRKRSHNKFFVFIKELFDIFINYKENKVDVLNNISTFKGTKFIVKGRLKGKTMATKIILQSGIIPIQSLSLPVKYASVHTFTQQFGVFGFKIWVYKTI